MGRILDSKNELRFASGHEVLALVGSTVEILYTLN
jgi:hypothetical protein